MKKIRWIIIICALMAVIVFSMTGCKESLVVTQVLYDQHQEEVDQDNPTNIMDEEPDADENTDELAEKKRDDSDRKTDEQKEGARRSEIDSDLDSVNTQQTDNAQNEGEEKDEQENEAANGNDANGASDADDQGQNPNGEQQNDTDYSSPNSDNPNADDPGVGDTDPNSDSETTRQVYNSNGDIVDLPENVGSIVAADEAGAMAVLLGGDGVLAGTSASLTTDSLAVAVLGDGQANAQTYWDGSGSSPMSEDNFQVLLANKPDACIGITGKNSFSGEQINRLAANGIAYVSLPALNSDESIRQAMSILAQTIGNRSSEGGKNAPKVAEEYEDYCISLVNDVSKKVSSDIAALYLSGWDYDATLIIATGNGDVLAQEGGLGVIKNDASENPLQYYLAAGGVINNAFQLTGHAGNLYAAIPLNINVHSLDTSVSGGSVSLYRPTSDSFARYQAGSGVIGLGEAQFPCVITNSQATKYALQQSKQAGIWQNFGKVTVDAATDYGFAAYDTLVRTWVRADFPVYVNPYGVTSWTDGSAESVLESVWAAYQINGAYSESDMKSEIRNFYQKFYGYTLSDSETDLILEGK